MKKNDFTIQIQETRNKKQYTVYKAVQYHIMSAKSFHFDSDFEFKDPVNLPGKTLEETLEIYFDQKCISPKELRTSKDSELISQYVKLVADNVAKGMNSGWFTGMYNVLQDLDFVQVSEDYVEMKKPLDMMKICRPRELNLYDHYMRLFGDVYDPYSMRAEQDEESLGVFDMVFNTQQFIHEIND